MVSEVCGFSYSVVQGGELFGDRLLNQIQTHFDDLISQMTLAKIAQGDDDFNINFHKD
jgi:hypothetical protein